MKKYLIAIAAFLFTSITYAQDNPDTEYEEHYKAIDKTKDEIKSNISTYKKVEKFKEDKTGYNRSYFLNDELKLVSVLFKDSTTEKSVEWYFYNGKLIYSWQLWTDIHTKDTLDYERFYLSNERLIGWFKFDKPVDRNTVVFKKIAYRMRDYISDLKRENQK